MQYLLSVVDVDHVRACEGAAVVVSFALVIGLYLLITRERGKNREA